MFIMALTSLLLHRPENGVSVVLEFDLAGGPQANRALAGGVVGQEFVGGSEVAGLVFAVVVVPGEDDLVSEVQDLAPAAFEVFRGAGVRQAVGSHCFVDRHGGFPPFGVFSPWGTVYILRNQPLLRHVYIRSTRGQSQDNNGEKDAQNQAIALVKL